MNASHPEKPHSITNQISVRRTTVDDLDAILEVRKNPKVSVQQYPISPFDTMLWKHALSQPDSSWCSWTILDAEIVIGNVTGNLKKFQRKNACSVGWNLLPRYWGNGIMHRAIHGVFAELAEIETELVVADRFEQNDRCAGLLRKLNFEEIPIGLMERTKLWLLVPCPHRIIRSILCLNSSPQQIEG